MAHGDLQPTEAPGSERLVWLTGKALTTTSGTLSTASGANDCEGFTLAKVGSEAGRYRATLNHKFKALQFAYMVVEGAADAAAAAAKGQVAYLRNVNMTTGIVEFQLATPSLAAGASVDVEPEDGATLRVVMCLSRGTI